MSGTAQKPRLLDLFCGAGGAAKGYQDAGFYVIGVDIAPQPNYCGDVFVQADALEILNEWHLEAFDVIHASPPCQDYSKALRHLSNPTPRLIEPVREILKASEKLWVIENVDGAPLPRHHTLYGEYGSMFCGSSFGLRVNRHRLFEANWPILGSFCNHTRPPLNPYYAPSRAAIYEEFPNDGAVPDWPEVVWRREMGVEWMNREEGREAIPPVFTREIGRQLLEELWRRIEPDHFEGNIGANVAGGHPSEVPLWPRLPDALDPRAPHRLLAAVRSRSVRRRGGGLSRPQVATARRLGVRPLTHRRRMGRVGRGAGGSRWLNGTPATTGTRAASANSGGFSVLYSPEGT